jgi:HAD superfamily hydrolase (TIGR01509 family)
MSDSFDSHLFEAGAFIFDVDGTLVDSVDLHAAAWQEAFGDFGHDIPYAEIRSQIGKGGDQLMPVFLPEKELRGIGEALERYRSNLFKEKYLPRVSGFPRVRDLFTALRDAGKAIAVASSSKKDELQVYERIANIADLVDVAISGDDVDQSKPHGDIFVRTLEKLRRPPADAIVVGDTPYDAEAAGKAGLRTIGVRCGGFPERDLREAGCVAIFDDPADLLENFIRATSRTARAGT